MASKPKKSAKKATAKVATTKAESQDGKPASKKIVERMRSLERELHRHSRLYYVENAPEIEDSKFDALFKELQELEREYPNEVSADSPTRRVGSDLDSSFEKFKHTIPVLSLANTYSTAEALEWAAKVADGNAATEFLVEWKVDGATLVLYYEQGRLVRAVTRGSGQTGDVVTNNALTIRGVPHLLEEPVTLTARGEVYMTFADFARFNESEGNVYANPRNLAAGTLKHKKSQVVATRPLLWTGFDITFAKEVGPGKSKSKSKSEGKGKSKGKDKASSEDKLAWATLAQAKRLGLPINGDTRVVKLPELEQVIAGFESRRHDTALPVDGLVIKLNDLSLREELGFTATTPRWATALKFEPESGETLVRGIDVFTGRTGRVTPRAALEPVRLAGTTVSFATLHNADYIEKLGVRVGSLVRVTKRGEIIPAVEEVIKQGKGPRFRFPTKCPSCKTKLIREEGAVDWLCPNSECDEKLISALVFFCGRKQMDIAGLGEKVLRTLFEHGLIRYPEDIYQLPKHQTAIEELEGFGKKSAALLLEGIAKSKQREFRFVLPALGLRDIGPSVTELLLSNGYRSIDAIRQLAAQQNALEILEEIDGIGPRTAALFTEQFRDPNVLARIEGLRRAGVQMSATEQQSGPDLPPTMADQVWCITGSFENFRPRDLAADEVRRRGGRISSAVSAKTTHLLAGESAGSKLEKATKLGVTIVSEAEFMKMIKA